MRNIYDKLLNVNFKQAKIFYKYRNDINQIAHDKFEHNYEKLEKGKNIATLFKKGGFITAGLCAAIGGIVFLTKLLPTISGVFGPWGVAIYLLTTIGLLGCGVYKCASSYKENAEKKQLMGLMQHGEALKKDTISAQAGLITSTYTNAEDIPLIQKQVCVQSPVGLEENKGKDKEDDNKEKGEKNGGITINFGAQ